MQEVLCRSLSLYQSPDVVVQIAMAGFLNVRSTRPDQLASLTKVQWNTRW